MFIGIKIPLTWHSLCFYASSVRLFQILVSNVNWPHDYKRCSGLRFPPQSTYLQHTDSTFVLLYFFSQRLLCPSTKETGWGRLWREKFWVISKPKFKRWLAFYYFPVLGSFIIESHWYLPLPSPAEWLAKNHADVSEIFTGKPWYHWSWISENLLTTIPLIKHLPSLKSEFQA